MLRVILRSRLPRALAEAVDREALAQDAQTKRREEKKALRLAIANGTASPSGPPSVSVGGGGGGSLALTATTTITASSFAGAGAAAGSTGDTGLSVAVGDDVIVPGPVSLESLTSPMVFATTLSARGSSATGRSR